MQCVCFAVGAEEDRCVQNPATNSAMIFILYTDTLTIKRNRHGLVRLVGGFDKRIWYPTGILRNCAAGCTAILGLMHKCFDANKMQIPMRHLAELCMS